MKRSLVLFALPLLLAAGCATSQVPTRQNTASFEETNAGSSTGAVPGGAGVAATTATAATPIELGSTPEMVKAALGEPEHIRAKASGRSLMSTWSYPNYGAAGQTLHVTFRQGQVAALRQEAAPVPAGGGAPQ